MSNSLQATFTLGFLGAGQLARMSALQAFRFGIQTAVYSDRAENEPVQFITPHSFTGSFSDTEAMIRFARTCDLVTLENEFIDSGILRQVEQQSGTPVYPSPDSFALIENKLIEKQTFEKAGIPVTPYLPVDSRESMEAFGHRHGWPYLLKSSKGGYDGYGNKTVDNIGQAAAAYHELGGEEGHTILAEAFVSFSHELAVQVARNQTGTVVYPCCETIQKNHICAAVKTPAPIDPELRRQAGEMAVSATEAIGGRGIFAYEFFLTTDGRLLLNESAPRPHNSGHYTIEGCVTSQFENHVRAVLGLPLGDTSLRKPAIAMVNLTGSYNRPAETEGIKSVLALPDAHLHVYGKLASRKGRKMGHLTLLGENLEQVYGKAVELAGHVRI
ncbi:MAG: 5-(carboxyamino)imidazole ribonucleotide synthase [Balneolaceae bacterium]